MRRFCYLIPLLLVASGCGHTLDRPGQTRFRSATESTTSHTTVNDPTPDTPTSSATTGSTQGLVAYGSELNDGGPAIVLLDAVTGDVRSVLVGSSLLGDGAGDLHFDPSSNLLYYSRVMTACSSEVVAIDPATGDEAFTLRGSVPAVSPDGRFVATALDPVCQRQHDIVITDLTDGSERIWVSELDEKSGLLAAVTRLSWSPDGSTLAVEVLYEDGVEVRLLDAMSEGGSIADGRRLSSLDGDWRAPLFLGDGTLVVSETCCEPEPDHFRLMKVDQVTGVGEEMLEMDMAARPVDRHPVGDGILLITTSSEEGELMSFVDGRLSLVRGGVADAVYIFDHSLPEQG